MDERAGPHRATPGRRAIGAGRSLPYFVVPALQLVDFGGRILVEALLFIGLIAVVRRVLVLMAEAEGGRRAENTGSLVQIGALGGLALVLALAIHVLGGRELDAGDDEGP